MARDYRYISADAHLDVNPDRWRNRVVETYRDCAPRLVQLPNTDAILVEGHPLDICTNLRAGVPPDQWTPGAGIRFEEMPGSGSPEQRLHEQDVDGVDAEVLYPEVGARNGWSTIEDDDAHCAVIHAYNEWLAEEYCSVAPDRLIGIGAIPERGLPGAMKELEHCAQLGLKGVVLNSYPSGRLLTATHEDDAFWAATLDLGLRVTFHGKFSGSVGLDRRAGRSTDRLGRQIAGGIAGQLAVTGLFDRFPSLQIYLAENQLGELPHTLEQLDIVYEKHHYGYERAQDLEPISRPPSEIVKEHFFWGFSDSPIGVRLRDHIGVDRIMWSTNFPHLPSRWPHSAEVIERNFQGVPEGEKHGMVAGNCMRLFGIE
jgi:uncharacterized protein